VDSARDCIRGPSTVSTQCTAQLNSDVRLPEAIQAHTRALLGADRVQTPNILAKLASLHTSIALASGASFSPEATDFHRKLLALGEQDGTPTAELAGSYIAIAEWEMGAEGEKGDWSLAATYLEKVAETNSPMRDKAAELLRQLRLEEARAAVRGYER
jgi:anaphase-promoting complex subunit 8